MLKNIFKKLILSFRKAIAYPESLEQVEVELTISRWFRVLNCIPMLKNIFKKLIKSSLSSFNSPFLKGSTRQGEGFRTSNTVGNLKTVMFLGILLSLFLVNSAPTSAATEFVSIIDPDNGADGTATDYTSLSAWESAVQADLTIATTKVFSYNDANASGDIPDGVTVIGETSGATATSTHLTASTTGAQIMLTNITGAFQNGEKVYVEGASSNYVYLADAGDSVIAVAECRSTGGGADTTAVSVDGWTTSASNYIKIWTNPTDVYGRHNGKLDNDKYRLEFADNESLKLNASYVKIIGIQIVNNDLEASGNTASILIYNRVGIEIESSIVNGPLNATGILFTDVLAEGVITNTLIYNSGDYGSLSEGIYADFSNTVEINNVTIYGFNDGIEQDAGTVIVTNSAILNCDDDFDGIMTINNSASDDGDGTNAVTPADWDDVFVDYANYDFRLMPESVAVDAGTTTVILSGSEGPRDIAGNDRLTNLTYDIGAFEAPQILYRSVGRHTSDLALVGTTVTIADKKATFSQDLPDNVGVGDVLQIGTGTPYTLAFIHGRTASNTFSVLDKVGDEVTATSSAPVAVFRAHLKMNNWEAQTAENVNQAIDASLQSDVLVNMDLVASNTNMFVPCYASTTYDNFGGEGFEIDGWTTGTSTYIKIYTPNDLDEAGVSQRHLGIWDDAKYRIAGAKNLSWAHIDVKSGNVRFEGLQMDVAGGIGIKLNTSEYGNIYLDKMIIRNNINSNYWSIIGSGSSTIYINNLLAYDILNAIRGDSSDYAKYRIYNSTFIKSNLDIDNGYNAIRYALAKNVVALNFGGINDDNNFEQIHASSSNLICNDNGYSNPCDAYPNSIDTTQDLTALFTDPENYDYSIRDIYSDLFDKGTTITIIEDGVSVPDDILGNSRAFYEAYDIGAFEYYSSKAKYRFSPGGSFKMQGTIKFK